MFKKSPKTKQFNLFCSPLGLNSSKSESPHFGAIFRLQEAFSRCINNSFANWLPKLVNAEDCIKAFKGICLIQI